MMDYRNPVFSSADGLAIDMEIDHPVLGWIPFTASQNDVEATGRELYAAALAAGGVLPYDPPPAPPYQIAKTTPWIRMTAEEASVMDGVMQETDARTKQIYMAATYLASNDPLWQTLWQILADAFGADRANALLAPET